MLDSYSGVVDYENIPSYTSDTTGEIFQLRDCLDFNLELMTHQQLIQEMQIEVMMVLVHQTVML